MSDAEWETWCRLLGKLMDDPTTTIWAKLEQIDAQAARHLVQPHWRQLYDAIITEGYD